MNWLLGEYSVTYHALIWVLSTLAYVCVAIACYRVSRLCVQERVFAKYGLVASTLCAVLRAVSGSEAFVSYWLGTRNFEQTLHHIYGFSSITAIGFLLGLAWALHKYSGTCRARREQAVHLTHQVSVAFETLQSVTKSTRGQ